MEIFDPKKLAELDRTKRIIEAKLSKRKPQQQTEYLHKTAEFLESKRAALIQDAQTEARLLNILYDLGDIRIRPLEDGSREFDEYLDDYLREIMTIMQVAQKSDAEPSKMDTIKTEMGEITKDFNIIFKKESLEEEDFEIFTDLLLRLKEIRSLSFFNIKQLKYKPASEALNRKVDKPKSEEPVIDISVSKIKYVESANFGYGRYRSAQVLVMGTIENGKEITAYADHGLRDALDIYQLNRNRFEIIRNFLPERLRVIRKSSSAHPGEYYYVVHPDDIEAWTNQIIAAVPEISQKYIRQEFLPPGLKEENGQIVSEKDIEEKEWETSISDPARIKFLNSLEPLSRVETKAFNSDRKYSAFIFQRRDRRIVVIATDKTQNADYIFWADNDDWIPVAQKTKLEVRTQFDSLFVGRLIHTKNWRINLQNYIFGNKESLN